MKFLLNVAAPPRRCCAPCSGRIHEIFFIRYCGPRSGGASKHTRTRITGTVLHSLIAGSPERKKKKKSKEERKVRLFQSETRSGILIVHRWKYGPQAPQVEMNPSIRMGRLVIVSNFAWLFDDGAWKLGKRRERGEGGSRSFDLKPWMVGGDWL